jgi:hypothetical protein
VYIHSALHKEIQKVFPSGIIGEEFTYTELSKKLNSVSKKFYSKVRVIRDDTLAKTKTNRQIFDISGYFDFSRKKLPITITLHLLNDRNTFYFTKASYNRLMFCFSQTIQHELIHKNQFLLNPNSFQKKIHIQYSEKVSKDRKKEIQYLSDYCEIEAYAHDIAMEINYGYSNINPNTIISKIDSQRKIPSYHKYKKAFKGTEWSRVKKSLLRKVWKWIPSAKPPKLL